MDSIGEKKNVHSQPPFVHVDRCWLAQARWILWMGHRASGAGEMVRMGRNLLHSWSQDQCGGDTFGVTYGVFITYNDNKARTDGG